MPQDPLENLRDIHLPEAVSWWPLAPGWWILALLLLCLLVVAVIMLWQRRQANAYRELARKELEQAWKSCRKKGDVVGYVSRCNQILRRAALHRDPANRHRIAPLSGKAWFDYLDGCCNGRVFASSVDADLHTVHYRKADPRETANKASALHRAAITWLREHDRVTPAPVQWPPWRAGSRRATRMAQR